MLLSSHMNRCWFGINSVSRYDKNDNFEKHMWVSWWVKNRCRLFNELSKHSWVYEINPYYKKWVSSAYFLEGANSSKHDFNKTRSYGSPNTRDGLSPIVQVPSSAEVVVKVGQYIFCEIDATICVLYNLNLAVLHIASPLLFLFLLSTWILLFSLKKGSYITIFSKWWGEL